MTLAELIKEFIDTSKERLKTPISGAFLWSFIIWNWRAFAVLFFSEAPIEDKIVFINYEYCNFWAILFPAVIALLYLILVPKLMLEIDKTLINTKQLRVKNVYKAKIYDAIERKELAKVEFDLKSIESGKKDIQDLLAQIDGLKEANANIIETNNNTTNQLNKKLKDSNKMIQNFLKTESNRAMYNEFRKELNRIDWREMDVIIDAYIKKGDMNKAISSVNAELLFKLNENQYITSVNDKYELTNLGREFIELL
ncbi:hypothetical protein [Flavobacterium sp. LB2P6]|uniref:hypothetical protein n=1 Tax=Flavobacterium sp. LB2P6 TaxID=3401714 RepID=UPI003AAECF22